MLDCIKASVHSEQEKKYWKNQNRLSAHVSRGSVFLILPVRNFKNRTDAQRPCGGTGDESHLDHPESFHYKVM